MKCHWTEVEVAKCEIAEVVDLEVISFLISNSFLAPWKLVPLSECI